MSAILAGVLVLTCGCTFISGDSASSPSRYHQVFFYDWAAQRGVPLVEMTSNNNVRYVSDSAGRVAIDPSDFDHRYVYFKLHSHGYRFEEDKDGFAGITLELSPGRSQTIRTDRINIAERLYRITGDGLYRDSRLLELQTPLNVNAETAGGVFGQDSTVNAIFNDTLYWFWGDTKLSSRRLGNFRVTGATSALPENGGLDPNHGVQLHYFIGQDATARSMVEIPKKGIIWLSGPVVVDFTDKTDTMIAYYARMRGVGEKLDHGVAQWDETRQLFAHRNEFPKDSLTLSGHPVKVANQNVKWLYSGYSFPDTRVEATLQAVTDPDAYQSYSPLRPGTQWNAKAPPLDLDSAGRPVWGWKQTTGKINFNQWKTLVDRGSVNLDEWPFLVRDAENGEPINTHAGHMSWNEYRQRWVMLFVQVNGGSYLGDVWLTESLSPTGPWSPATRIIRHDNYSFYNVKQHPYFAHGPYIYFEGTYTTLFSGNQEPTPRYDYNQIMYRVNLDEERLKLGRLGDKSAGRCPTPLRECPAK